MRNSARVIAPKGDSIRFSADPAAFINSSTLATPASSAATAPSVGKKLGSLPLPGLSLGLTAEAAAALQGNLAFPGPDPAGFAAIWSCDASLMNITAVREAILQSSGTSGRRSGQGTLIEVGNNYLVSDVKIYNMVGTTTVRLFASSRLLKKGV